LPEYYSGPPKLVEKMKGFPL